MFRLRRMARPTRKRRPRFDLLEDRTVPAAYDWTGSAADSNWATPNNWNVGGSPATSYPHLAGDLAQFTGSYSAAINVTYSAAIVVGEIDFGYTGGKALTLTQGTGGTLTLNNGTPGSAAAINVTGSATQTVKITGNFTATNGGVTVLVNDANATLTIGGAVTTGSTYGEYATVNTGTLIQNNNAAGTTIGPNSTFTVNGGSLNTGSNATFANSQSNFGTGPITLNGGILAVNNATLPAVLSNSLLLDSNASTTLGGAPFLFLGGTFTLNGSNTLKVNSSSPTAGLTPPSPRSPTPSSASASGTNTLTVSTASTGVLSLGDVTFAGSNPIVIAGKAITLASAYPGILSTTPTLTVNVPTTISSALTGTVSSLNVNGSNTLLLSGANTYVGATDVLGGTLVLGASGTLPSTTNLVLGSASTSGTLDLAGFNQTVAGLGTGTGATGANQKIGNSSTTSNSTLTFSGTESTFGGVLQDTLGAGTKTLSLSVATGALTLTGAETYTGATAVSGGSLIVNGSLAAGSAVSVAAGATLGGTGTVSGAVSDSGTLNAAGVGSAGTLNTGALILGGGTLVADVVGASADEIVVNGTADLSSGTIVLGTASYSGAPGSTVTILHSTAGLTPPSSLPDGSLLIANGQSFVVHCTATDITLQYVQAPTFTSLNSADFVVGSAGSFPVVVTGFPAPSAVTEVPGDTLPSGVTFAGGVLSGTPAAGTAGSYTLHFSSTSALGTTTQTFTLSVDQSAPPTAAYVSSANFGLDSAPTLGQLIADADLGTSALDSGNQPAVFGTSAFATAGDALAAVGTAGTVIVNSGTYSESPSLSATGQLVLSGDVTLNSLSDASGNVVNLQGNTLTLGDAADASVLLGVVQGTGGLVKTASDTLTLGAANTYSGPTAVAAGTLAVNGSIAASSTVSVSAGAVLVGTGSILGAATVSGTVSPASTGTVGTLSFGSIAFAGGSSLSLDLASGASDEVVASGPVSLAGAVLNLANSNTDSSLPLGTVLTIVQSSTPIAGTFAGLPEGTTIIAGGQGFKISYLGSGGDAVTLTRTTFSSVYQWVGGGANSNWNTAANWQLISGAGSFPNGVGDVAEFTGGYTAAVTPTFTSAITVGEIDFGGSSFTGNFGITFSGATGGSLTLKNPSGPAVINVLSSGNTAAEVVKFNSFAGGLAATSGGVSVTLASGTLGLTISGPISTGIFGENVVINAGTLVQNNNVAATTIGPSSTFVVNNGGTLSLGASATFTNSQSNIGTGQITLNNGATLKVNNANDPVPLANNIVFGLNASVTLSGAPFLFTGGTITLDGNNTLAVNNSAPTAGLTPTLTTIADTVVGILSGTNTLTIAGSSSLSLGDTTFAGSNPIVVAGNSITLPKTTSYPGALSTTPTITVKVPTTITSNLVGTVSSLNLAGTSTLLLAGSNIYVGDTDLLGGKLVLGSSAALPATTNLNLGSSTGSATVDLAGFSPTIAGLGLSAGANPANQIVGNSSTVSGSTLTVGGSNTTFGGILEDALGAGTQTLALTVVSGTLTLNGNETYTGPTTVSGGSLIVNGSIAAASSITVAAGGTLGGTGSITAATVSGNVNPATAGTSGTFSAGTLVFTSGSTYTVDAVGAGNDEIVTTGNADLGNAAIAIGVGSYTGSLGSSFTILQAAGTLTVPATQPDGTVISAGSQFFEIHYSASAITLEYVQPPTFVATTTSFIVGQPGSFNVQVTGFPTPSAVTENPGDTLPAGVTYSGGALSGTPAAGTSGSYTLHFTSTNSIGTTTQAFTLNIDQPPAITSPSTVSFVAGVGESFTFTATGFPSSTFSLAAGDTLPSGVTLTSGLLSGVPTKLGTYTLHLTSSNGVGAAATQTVTLKVDPGFVVSSFADGAVYAIDARNGALAATLVAPGGAVVGPSGVTIGPDGNLYVSSQYGDAIDQINLATHQVSTFITLPAGTQPGGLTFGPDGNLYVSSYGTGSVSSYGIFSNAGVLTFTGFVNTIVSGGLLQPSGLAFGVASGDTTTLYVSSNSDNGSDGSVVRILNVTTVPGTPTPYFVGSVAHPLNQPAGLTFGLDGKLYVVDLGATDFQGQVLRLVPTGDGSTGAFDVNFAQPASNLQSQDPSGIAFDDQGNLFTADLGSSLSAPYQGSIAEYGPSGTFVQTLTSSSQFPAGFIPSALAFIEPATLTSASTTTFLPGQSSTFNVTATGSPAPIVTVTGNLPSGVTYANGILSGTPDSGTNGAYALTVTATNGIGVAAAQTLVLVVSPISTYVASDNFGLGSTPTYGTAIPASTETGFQSAVYGVNAFSSIAAALAAAGTSGAVLVNAGTYAESPVVSGTETLRLLGNVTVNSLDSAAGATVDLQGNTLTVGNSTGADTIAGAIAGAGGSLVKVGSDSLTLGGTDTYTGPTTVSAGALIVNGSLGSSTVSVTGSGILGGAGSIGSVTSANVVNPGAPGTPDVLTVGNLSLGSSSLVLDLASTGFDSVTAVDSVDITGTTLSLNVGTVVPGETFTILTVPGTDVGARVGTFANLPDSTSSFTVGSLTFAINYAGGDGNDIILTASGTAPTLVSTVLNGGIAYINSTLAANQHSMVENVVYSFSQAVNLSASNFTLSGFQGTPATLVPNVNVSGDSSGTVWTVTFSGVGVNGATHSIGDGEYSLVLGGVAGLSNTFDFFRLLGDMNGDGTVNTSDFATLISTFLRATTDPLYLGADDFDLSGGVDTTDFTQFTANFLKSVPSPLPN